MAHTLLLGAVGAGIVHAALMLALPAMSAAERWKDLALRLPPNRMTTDATLLFTPDPFFRLAACRFDLEGGPVRLTARGAVSAWSLSVQAPDGASLGGVGDGARPDGSLDVLVLTPAQRPAAAPQLDTSAPLEVDAGEALAILEVFVPDRSWSGATEAFLASASCMPARKH